MEFDAICNHRRSINFFNNTKKIPLELLEEMITLATKPPSSFNLHPWHLVTLTVPHTP